MDGPFAFALESLSKGAMLLPGGGADHLQGLIAACPCFCDAFSLPIGFGPRIFAQLRLSTTRPHAVECARATAFPGEPEFPKISIKLDKFTGFFDK